MSDYDRKVIKGYSRKDDRRWTRWKRYVEHYEQIKNHRNRYGWSFVEPRLRDEHRRQWKEMMS